MDLPRVCSWRWTGDAKAVGTYERRHIPSPNRVDNMINSVSYLVMDEDATYKVKLISFISQSQPLGARETKKWTQKIRIEGSVPTLVSAWSTQYYAQ